MWSQEGLYFNVKHGYLGTHVCPKSQRTLPAGLTTFMHAEAVVRGHKSGLFSATDYNNLCQCESLEDIKLHLVSSPFQYATS